MSLSFVTFRVSRSRVSHLTHETVKLCLQNALNMSKTTKVYFGVLQQQCPPEEECQSDTMAEEKCEQQPHQKVIEDFIELSEGLCESSYMCDVFFPRENQE